MKKSVSIFLSVILVAVSLFTGMNVLADEAFTVTVSEIEGKAGDEVYVPVNMENNPGITAITATFSYDPNALEYISYERGYAFTDNTMQCKAHPDKKIIKMALCEFAKESKNDGSMIIFKFKIKDDAPDGFSKINFEYRNGDIANKKAQAVVPQVTSGGVNIHNESAKNCEHASFTEWTVSVEARCEEPGVMSRNCIKCGYTETKEIPPAGHEYEKYWTVDTPATESENGVMSRHCLHCTSTVDSVNYTFEQSKKINNQAGENVDDVDFTKELFKEQHPDEKITPEKPGYDNSVTQEDKITVEKSNENNGIVKKVTEKIKDEVREKVDENIDKAISDIVPKADKNLREQIISKIAEVYPNIDNTIDWVLFSLFVLIIF